MALSDARGTEERPLRVSFPRGAWAGLAIFGILLLGSLGAQLALIHNQRDITRQQRKIASRQFAEFKPFLKETRPLVSDTKPLVRDLSRGDLPETLQGLGTMAATTNQNQRLSRLLRSAITVLGTVRSTGLVDLAARAARLVPPLIPRLDRAQRRVLAVLERSLALQRQALRVNRATLATATQTLQVARSTDGHAASLDRKLGGQLPGTRGGR